MIRYLGYILILLASVGWALGIGAILAHQLGDRLVTGDAVAVTGFDRVLVPGHPQSLWAALVNADTGLPTSESMLIVRFDSGWIGQASLRPDGFAVIYDPPRLGIGAHRFMVDLPDARPRLDVHGYGTVWVRPADAPVFWIDAAALVSPAEAVRGDATVIARREEHALRIIKALAVRRLPVYLVSCDVRSYAPIRRLILGSGAPRGPVLWMQPGSEASRLADLSGVWPHIEGAAMASSPFVDAARKLKAKVDVWRVPAAGQPHEASPGVLTWDDVLDGLPAPRGTGAGGEK
jgi:hypothetical protein